MKIAFDSEIFYLQKAGGISVHFSNIISKLSVIDKLDLFILVNKKKKNKCITNESFKNIYNLKQINFIYYGNFFDLKFKLRDHKIDILHSTYYSFFNLFLCKKLVYTFHDAAPERFFLKFLNRFYILKIFFRFLCFLMADGISFISEFSLKEFKIYYKTICKLFPNKKYLITGNDICLNNPNISDGSNLNFDKNLNRYLNKKGTKKIGP